nr:uncharacterized protein CI109_000729 [Kwoniella shandongensis]KAA5531157.1 hypothetical protein CI109_000729 [Kwoniella shandongensis]
MPAVSKKLSDIFSCSPSGSPRNSPRNSPLLSPTKLNDTVPPLQSTPVSRSGMPCSSQLFDLFKFVASGRNNGDLDPEVDSDEDDDEVSLHISPEQQEEANVPQAMPAEPAVDNDVKLEKWIDETIRKTELQRDTLSSRFTALSLSNLSPWRFPGSEKALKRPRLPGKKAQPSPELDESPVDTPLEAPTGRPFRAAVGVDDIPDEDKLAAIVDEFGEIAGLLEGDEPERILAESKGSLFKGVMMVGNIHLTTHRILFHAFLPPDSVAMAASTMDPRLAMDSAAAAFAHQPDVIHAGPVTVHRPGSLKPARRVWMELSAEMVTTYPSADEAGRVRPLRSVLLSSVRQTEPFNADHPCDFYVTYETPYGQRRSRFTVDTEESAMQWRRCFEAALFRHVRTRWRESLGHGPSEDWSMMRCCIPLDRVTVNGISSYHSFSTLIGLDIQLDDEPKETNVIETSSQATLVETPVSSPGVERKGSFRAFSRGRSAQGNSTEARSPSPLIREAGLHPSMLRTEMSHKNFASASDSSFDFNIAVLKDQAWFAQAFESAVDASHQRKYKHDAKRPRMVLQVAGHDCLATDEDLESDRSGSYDSEEGDDEEDGHNGLLRETRKAEKAALSAKVFGLKEEEGVWIKRCYVGTSFIPARGHIILTPRFICYWRRATVGADIKYRFRIEDVKGAVIAPGLRARFHGMALQLHGHRDLRFEFWKRESRDEVMARINDLRGTRTPAPSVPAEQKPSPPLFDEPIARTASPASNTVVDHPADILAPPRDLLLQAPVVPADAVKYIPYIANKPLHAMARIAPRTFTCLTIGSRGDIQPYIALCLRLKQDGHKVVIVTHGEFKTWVEGYGIEHRQAGGDPTALMKLSTEHKMFSPGFFKESLGSFRTWLDDLLLDSWNACQDSDVLIESPSTMAGVHIAEALKIPYFRAFTMPWTRTSAYPHAFMVPAFEMGPSFNYSTYVLFDNIMWRATSGQINKWRKHYLGLKFTDMTALSLTKIPFLYNFSAAVVPKPLDWHDDIVITGYWNLEDSDTEWSPPPELEAFMAKAKEDQRPLVYIGFGSIVVPRPNAMTKSIIKAVEKANVRAIIAKGWSSRGGDPAKEGEEIVFPPSCYGVDKIPHSWLFPRVQAALHHGGAGTVGASLRAGIPTLIKPWFGDQFFWSIRVTKLEVGLKVPSLRSDDIAAALVKATTDRVMMEKAARIGERIRSENGVNAAVQAIHNNLSRAGADRTKMRWAK